MGDIGTGLYVSPDVVPVYKNMLKLATIITPNQFEAQYVVSSSGRWHQLTREIALGRKDHIPRNTARGFEVSPHPRRCPECCPFLGTVARATGVSNGHSSASRIIHQASA